MKVLLQKQLLSLLFLALACILTGKALATNIVLGGYISYQHVSSQTYTVYLTYWGSCNETKLDTCYLRIEDQQTGDVLDSIKPNQRFNLINRTNYNQACQSAPLCNGFGTARGAYEVRWEYTVDFSNYSACSFDLSSTMVRTALITTGSSSTGFYISSNINLCYDTLPRSFLKFSNPELLIPRYSAYYDNGDYRDTLNYFDSFSYALIPARVDKSTSIIYSSFSVLDYKFPVPWFGMPGKNYQWPATVQMFPETGNYRFRATAGTSVGVLCYQVEGWKRINDTMRMLGSVVTDQALNTFNEYPSNAKRIHIEGVEEVAPICAGSSGFMDVVIHSQDDTIQYSLESHAGWEMRIDTLQNDLDSIKLRVWIDADTSMIRSLPYFFTVRARNFGCSYYTQVVQKGGFRIVDGSGYDKTSFHYSDDQRSCNENLLIASDTIYPNRSFTWVLGFNSTQSDSLYVADSVGWNVYYLQEKLATCSRSLVDSFYIDSLYHPSLALVAPDKYCAGDTATVQVIYSGGMSGNTYLWQDSSTSGQNIKPLLDDEKFGLRLIDGGGCVSYDSVFVHAVKLKYIPAPLDMCWERTFESIVNYFDHVVISGAVLPVKSDYYSLLGYSGDSIIRPTIDQQIGLHFEDSLGCEINDTISVNFRSGYGPLFLSPAEDSLILCAGEEVFIQLNDLNGLSGVNLSISGAGKTGKSFTIQPTDTMVIIASGRVTASRCRSYETKYIFVNPRSTVSVNSIDGFCGDSSLLLDLGPYATPSTGTWSGEGVFKQGANYYYHSDSASNGKQTLRYSLKHPTSPCVTKDSIEFDKNEPILLDFSPNKVSGYGPLIISFATQVSGGANIQYLWDFGDGGSNTQKNPAYQYTDTGLFSVKVTATGKYCAASILKSDLIHVNEKPSSVYPNIQNDNRMVYPNPGNATFTIEGPIFAVTCINSLGQNMNLELINTSAEQTSYSILGGVPGVYYLKVQAEDSSQIIRYVILE